MRAKRTLDAIIHLDVAVTHLVRAEGSLAKALDAISIADGVGNPETVVWRMVLDTLHSLEVFVADTRDERRAALQARREQDPA